MTTSAKAQLRYLHVAPRKTRAVADVIRGLPAIEAEAQLLLMPRRAATPLLKLLRSAMANAKQIMKKDADALFIKEIRVDQGPKSKRWMPRARGAMSAIERKTSHVSLVLGVMSVPKASRFVIRKPVEKKEAEKKKAKSRPQRKSGRGSSTKSGPKHEHLPGRQAGEHERERSREEKKEGEKKGFAQRFFRRKAV